jgi:hypothetical protein
MPKFFGNKVGVFKHELIGEGLFPSYDALQKKLKRDEVIEWGIKSLSRGGNGRKLVVDYDTLPKNYQELILDPRKPKHPLVPYYSIDKEIRNFYHDYTYPDGSHLLPKTLEQLIVDASVLKALVNLENARRTMRQNLGHSLKDLYKSLFEDAQSFNEYLKKTKQPQHKLNTTYRHFRNQLFCFKQDGPFSIIKDPFGKNKMNAKKRTEKVEQLLRNLFAGRTHKPTPTKVASEYQAFLAGYIDVINKATGEVYNPKEFSPISNGTITAFLSKWESKIGTDAKRSGDRQQLINENIPYHSFEMPEMAGSMVSIDDRQPPFHYNANRDRMWWYIGFDLASKAIVAWAYGKSKKELILNFYKNMVANHFKWDLQMPAEVECESSLNSSFTDTFLEDGAMFEYVTMYRNMARSKRVERFFEELRYSEDFEKGRIGWLARPNARKESNQEGPKLEKRADGSDPNIIPYDTLVKQCFQDIITWNNMPVNKDSDVSRFDYYLQNQNPDLVATNYKSFIKDLGSYRESSCKKGIVKLNRQEWLLGEDGKIFTGEKLITQLKKVERKDIKIYFLDDGQGTIIKAFAYDVKTDRYLCELIQKPTYQKSKKEKTPEDAEKALLMAKYTNTVAIYQKNNKNTIEAVEIIKNKPITVSNSFSIDGFDVEETVNDTPLPSASVPETVEDYEDYDFDNYNPANDL